MENICTPRREEVQINIKADAIAKLTLNKLEDITILLRELHLIELVMCNKDLEVPIHMIDTLTKVIKHYSLH